MDGSCEAAPKEDEKNDDYALLDVSSIDFLRNQLI